MLMAEQSAFTPKNRKNCLLLYLANAVLLLFAAVHLVSTRDTWEPMRLEMPAAVIQESVPAETVFCMEAI